MYVLAKKKDEKRWQVQIVESVRDGKSVRQKIVRNVGTAYSEKEVSEFKRIGEAAIVEIKNAAKPVLSIFDPAEFHSPRKVGREINALFDIIDLPTALFGFAAFIFN